MTRSHARTITVLAFVAALTAANVAVAQEQRQPSIFDRMFGGNDRETRPESTPRAQNSPADLIVRIDRLEQQIRQLTGAIEQLQYRNQQLEAQLQRLQGASAPQAQIPGQVPGQAPGTRQPTNGVPPPTILSQTPPPPVSSQPPPIIYAPTPPGQTPPNTTGRRNDAFDPTQNPNAPGVPRNLGTIAGIPPGQTPPGQTPPAQNEQSNTDAPVGAPGGRLPGSPLDLNTMMNNRANAPANDPSTESNVLPPPPARNPSSTGVVASTLPPSASPRDQFDLGVGYIQRKEYALAEDTFQIFLTKYPSDKLAPDAQFWLGEARFQRQRYDAAAESFLAVSTKHTSSAKAPDAMLRLSQSLAALGQREMACATLAELPKKFPRASANVRQSVEREQKRVHC